MAIHIYLFSVLMRAWMVFSIYYAETFSIYVLIAFCTPYNNTSVFCFRRNS